MVFNIGNMDGPARERVLKLIDEKVRIENEIISQRAILETNNIGMNEPLVDEQGYPRNDIDVYNVRHARHKIICLENDYRKLMQMIEQGINDVHSAMRGDSNLGSQQVPTTTNGNGTGCNNSDLSTKEPFAVVTHVDNGSPADLAGLFNDDKILQFGTLTLSNFNDMSQIYNIVMHSLGEPIHVEVKRDRHVICLSIVPRPWGQPGLLGCHIQKLK